MNTEFFTALDLLCKDKGISPEGLIENIEKALTNAIKKEYGNNTLIRVVIDPEKKDIRVYRQKQVVEEVTDPETQISLSDAKKINRNFTLDRVVDIEEVKTKNLRRLSADAGKKVIIQSIRDAERKARQEAYESKRDEIITATVYKVDKESGTVVLDTGTSFATLPRDAQIPGETFEVGDIVRVFVPEVNREAQGPLVTLSRTHPNLVRRIFELEIPEISEGTVIVMNVAREAGSRTKISVKSRDPEVDPVGACIGNHGIRIEPIVEELRGEKIDIVKYSDDPAEYVAAALAPATITSVTVTEPHVCRVVVAPDQLSLAIGKEGQNARLAARLTGHKVDIKAE